GSFSGIASQVIPLDDTPTLLVPMKWNGQPALVSLDRAENSISLITGLGEPNPRVQTIASGGIGPAAAETFAAGGPTGVNVANSGDGAITVFVESPRGLTVTSSYISPNLAFTPSSSFEGATNLGVFAFAGNSVAPSSTLIGFQLIGQTITPKTAAVIALSPQ